MQRPLPSAGASLPPTGMEQLIPVINKLQDVFSCIGMEGIDLPQIVVVGSQSSGKSSVLENVVGRDFLPRGSGIVTRRPLVLQLINLPPSSTGKDEEGKFKEWGEFLHKPNEVFYDFNQIREEINRETDRLSGKNKGISNNPINLKIYSPYVLNLTLVDLPGITRVPVGDQPVDIETQIKRMVMTYISKPNAIILAVTAANTDLSNSDALQMAQDVDPEGNRTIGVITKIDLMDQGTDAMDMLMGRIIPLRLGYIGVINRSQQDIISKKPIREALKSEADFFATHNLYRSIASRCGTPYLAKTLNKILMNHIKDTLPELKAKINKMAADTQAEILTYGDPMYDGKSSQGALLLQIINKFSTDYQNAIEGKSSDLALHELCGGARINYIFNDIFSRCLSRINPTDGMTMNDIRTAIRNATGPRAALFIPETSFELLVKRQVSRLDEPSMQCIELVYDELQRIVSQLESKELLRFANLREAVVDVVNNLLQKCRSPTKEMIANIIALELAYVNTNHPDFIGGGGALNTVFERMAQTHAQEQQQQMMQQQQQQILQQQQMLQQQQQAAMQQQYPQQVPETSSSKKKPTKALPAQPNTFGGAPGNDKEKDSNFFSFFGRDSKQPMPQQPMPPVPARSATMAGGGMPAMTPMVPSQSTSSSFSAKSSSRESRKGKGGDKLDQVPSTIKAISSPSDKEKFETELIQSLLISYFNIVRKNVADLVPKSIMHFLVNQSKDKIQNELVTQLYKEELFDHLLEESPAISMRRSQCKDLLSVLLRAQQILNEVRETTLK